MGDQKRIIVIGGSAAGPKAAAKARRTDQHAEITIIQKGSYLSMASCGYPYYVGGYFDDRNKLISTPVGVVRDPAFFLKAKGIKALTQTEVIAIDREAHTVTARHQETGEETVLPYDKLVIATGATPFMPPVPGADLAGVTTLQSMDDADFLRKVRDEGKIKEAVVVGAGLIGVETCEALSLAGIKVHLIEMLPQILPFLDRELALLMENFMTSKIANVIKENPVTRFIGEDGQLTGVELKNGTELPCELAVVAVGVRPNTQLARDAGLAVGEQGGISVNEYMQTSDPDIYAAGDCCEVTEILSGRKVLAPFGDLANLEGRVVGQNVILGNQATFPGTLRTGICQIFSWHAGSTGLTEKEAVQAGFEKAVSVKVAIPDKPGFMGAKLLVLKMVADAESGRVLGVQCVGPGDVSKRIAMAAMAIQGKLTVNQVVCSDMPYAPPFSQAIDALITTAHVLDNKLKGRFRGITATALKEKVDAGVDMFLIDARSPGEYEAMRLGIGEVLIPLGKLRSQLDKLPADKHKEIICFCKISLRGYEAAGFLQAQGYTNVSVLEGGIMAWPFGREK